MSNIKYFLMKKPLSMILILVMFFTLGIGCGCRKDKPEPEYPENPLNGRTTAVFNPDKHYGTMNDIDGNIYKTVRIGNQTWMAENLRVTHYQNGDPVPNSKDSAEWNSLKTGAYCNYNNTDDLDTIATYGRLYNWYATSDNRNLAPKGWHVASAIDWNILIDHLGGDTIASKKLKEAGDLHWEDSYDSDNSSGFTALPGGSRSLYREFHYMNIYAIFWTSSDYGATQAPFLFLFYYDDNLWRDTIEKFEGFSIRCVKD